MTYRRGGSAISLRANMRRLHTGLLRLLLFRTAGLRNTDNGGGSDVQPRTIRHTRMPRFLLYLVLPERIVASSIICEVVQKPRHLGGFGCHITFERACLGGLRRP
jgi:hypothetical protein